MSKVILVVDDEEAIQELIQIYLSELDVKIYPALNGEKGDRGWRINPKMR